MPSKSKAEGKSAKAPTEKRSSIPRQSGHSKTFKKDWERYNKSGRSPMSDIKRVMGLILDNNGPLPPEYKDHELSGGWSGHRECHVHGDLLLIYVIEGKADDEKVTFVTLGTHAELFKGK